MKIALVCQSLLLSKALHSFLGEYIVPYKQCDFVISDKKMVLDKPIFYISSLEGDLIIPFSKASLLLSLDAFYKKMHGECEDEASFVFPTPLEDKIASLTERFRQELIQTLKDYYGN